MEYTLSIIKPDATKRNLIGKINTRLESAGLKIVAQKMQKLTTGEVEKFYSEHKDKSFFSDIVKNMTSAPVVLQVLKGTEAISKNRNIMGATNPLEASEGTIRKDFAKNIDANSIHGSDSPESAKREIAFFFSQNDIME